MSEIEKKETIMSYRDLEVWRKSMDLAEVVYKVTEGFPPNEVYGLTSQLRRASVSIVSNIAEGASRHSTKEFIHFLNLSNGSLSELEAQFELSVRLGYLGENEIQSQINHIRSMIFGLIKSLRKKL